MLFYKRLMWILWPSFLMAAVLEVLVFAMVDPHNLQWLGNPLELSGQSVYAVGFFMFWFATALSSGMTALLSMSSAEVNRCPFPSEERPASCAKPSAD